MAYKVKSKLVETQTIISCKQHISKISTIQLSAPQSSLTNDIQSRLQAIKQLHETVHHEKKQTLLEMFAQACHDINQPISIYSFKKIKLESIPYKKAKRKFSLI